MRETFYVTTPIYYVNARPHIGHAYTTIVADVLARRHRALGHDVWFLTGTDEHGQKIERSAAAAGIPPQQFTDEVSAAFKTLWVRMGLTPDQYIRTTDEAHKRGVQQLFRTLYDNGQIYLSSYTGQYSIGEEMFVEGPPGTLGPDGRPTETVTEENFFFRLSEYQLPLLNLIESDELKITPDSRKNEVLSFLRGNINPPTNPGAPGLASETWVSEPPQSNNQIRFTNRNTPYVPGALKDLSISRSSFTWGIPVPEDIQQRAGAKETHIIYVWLDALANYITALGYGSDDTTNFDKFWPADLHLVGKEIIRFHCVYWPAFLLAAGLPLPKAVTAHGWLLFEDSKMSKSKGNIVRTETILDAFGQLCPPPPAATPAPNASPAPDTSLKGTASAVPLSLPENDGASAPEVRSSLPAINPGAPGLASETWVPPSPQPTPHDRDLFAADVLRYFLLREIPFGQDGSFSFEALITRYNADLANGYGNLVSRTLSMIGKYHAGRVPTLNHVYKDELGWNRAATLGVIGFGPRNVRLIDGLITQAESNPSISFPNAIASIWSLVKWSDEILSLAKPWKERDSEELTKQVRSESLYVAAESIRILTALLHPILPYATAKVWRQLGLGDIEQAAASGALTNLQWGGLQPGTKLGPLGPIFPRADKKLAEVMTQMEQDKNAPLGANAAHDTTATETPEFKETTIASESESLEKKPLSKLVDETSGHTTLTNPTHFDPAAGPRTSSLPEPDAAQQVAGSSAISTERPGTESHVEAEPSGIFANATPTQDPQITIDDFAKVELRVAQVVVCERIPKADKLLRLEVDLGYEKRQILSGIAEWYTPEDLIGRRIVVITNLAPRKMRGLESHGMLLAASSEGGKPALATFLDSDTLPLGSRLK